MGPRSRASNFGCRGRPGSLFEFSTGDETYWFNFFYDTENLKSTRDTCEAPRGLLTPANVRVMCDVETELLERSYEAYCVASAENASRCAPLRLSLIHI